MEEELEALKRKGSDLSDIVLEKRSKSSVKTKKWILTAASAIVLFLILSLLYKMFSQNSQGIEQSNMVDENDNVESVAKDEEPTKNSENLFKKEPIIDESSDTDARFEELVKKLKEQDAITQKPQPQDITKSQTKEAESSQTEVKEVKPQELKTINQHSAEIPVITTPADKPKIIQTPVIRQSPPVVEHKPVTKPKPKPKPRVKKSPAQVFAQTKPSAVSGYFIQVGATSKSFPDKRFLSKIKNAGFDYIIHGVFVNGRKIKKVLVGPYNSKAAAQNALGRVKSSINPSAFIYRIK